MRSSLLLYCCCPCFDSQQNKQKSEKFIYLFIVVLFSHSDFYFLTEKIFF